MTLTPTKVKDNSNKPYYQDQELGLINYQYFQAPGGTLYFRGPMPPSLEKNEFFVCIGAAQTFGRFCEQPFSELISDRLNLPCLNLGYAGAGPSFYLKNDYLLETINKARFIIVQVMSGRSESNSRYVSLTGRNMLTRVSNGTTVMDTEAYKEILRLNSFDSIREIVQQTKYSWLRNSTSLLEKITIPKCLFWFSVRNPQYKMNFNNVKSLLSEFPHLIDSSLIDAVKPLADRYVECVSNRGLPQKLYAKNTTDAVEITYALGLGAKAKKSEYNKYYPSPEMHLDAADALLNTCQELNESSLV